MQDRLKVFAKEIGFSKLVLTGGCGKDEDHTRPNSWHFKCKAVDLGFNSNKQLNPDEPEFIGWEKIMAAGEKAFGKGWLMIVEKDHFHIQPNYANNGLQPAIDALNHPFRIQVDTTSKRKYRGKNPAPKRFDTP